MFSMEKMYFKWNEVVYVPSSCPAAQPKLPNFHLPKQNQADSGMTKIIITHLLPT